MIADQKKNNERKKIEAYNEKEEGDKLAKEKWLKYKTTLKKV